MCARSFIALTWNASAMFRMYIRHNPQTPAYIGLFAGIPFVFPTVDNWARACFAAPSPPPTAISVRTRARHAIIASVSRERVAIEPSTPSIHTLALTHRRAHRIIIIGDTRRTRFVTPLYTAVRGAISAGNDGNDGTAITHTCLPRQVRSVRAGVAVVVAVGHRCQG